MEFLRNLTKLIWFWPGAENESFIDTCVQDFDASVKGLADRYVLSRERDALREQWYQSYKKVKSFSLPRWHYLYPKVHPFVDRYEPLDDVIETINREYVNAELERCKDFLSDIDGKSLDEQQRTAVVVDASRNLVLAGAGSGKTLTISGKVKYLCEKKNISPEDILLIAFTRKSAEEMTTRISERLGIPIQATTFHKLGLDIIKAGTGSCPDVLDSLSDFVRDYFENTITQNQEAIRSLIEYFAYYLHIPSDMENFDSLGDVYEHEKGLDFETIQSKYTRSQYAQDNADRLSSEKRTLQNETVKSLEEVSIANFLFLHGVRYEYEKLYPYKSDDGSHKPYRPDFYLPDYDIYLEHFGINKDGRLPWLSDVEERKYQEGMRWKRGIHKQHNTKLLETYSYYSSEGRLLERLESKLKENGVKFHTPDFAEIFNAIYAKESDKYFSEFMKLCSTFITLFKSNGYKPSELNALRSSNPKHQSPFHIHRTQLFKSIMGPLLVSYEEYLQKSNAVDFSDMINQATEIALGGYSIHPYRWVIIDEFQDISMARYKLVDAILKITNAQLLCVGDDWQSIYRFAGSDITLFTQFEQHFGDTKIMAIEKTYRNSQQLIDAAGAFVTRNPMQMKKDLRSDKRLDYPITFMCYQADPFAMLHKTVQKIIQEFGAESSIMLLGRTQYDMELVKESGLFEIRSSEKIIFKEAPQVPIFFLTIHKAKGLEADNVVLLNFQNSTLGFPNKISDDPILELVLTQGDNFIYAEERRLLYVALTRTRNRIFILTDSNQPSEFFREFKPSKSVFILSKALDTEKKIKCPRCKTGDLVVRKNEASNKYFVGCTNFPHCDYTVSNTAIMTDTRRCPRCGGFLVKRKGKFGYFYGCTNYPHCNFTEEQPRKETK